ncbi:MAG TPA: hypothetical protein PLP19_08105 [bacterium]|nr:hypothetical protein [bacterium]HPN43435.1 hypothetical protein [bacterium]
MIRSFYLLIIIGLVIFMDCAGEKHQEIRRFFSKDSFWNTPLAANVEIDPRNDEFIALLETEPNVKGFGINLTKWTIPVYDVDSSTPVHTIERHYLSPEEKKHWNTDREAFGHGPGFDRVPIPDAALPDPEEDAHFAVIDWKRKLVWDMWGFRIRPDSSWESNTGMVYRIDGDGIFRTSDFDVKNGESIHFHGPSRAAGVPAIAGLIMYDEVQAGEINHKLAGAVRFTALQQFVYPASWTDGYIPNGIPEGAIIQLDPAVDLSQFNLLPGEIVVARALQIYGMVIVDTAGGSTLYGEGLWGHPGKSWNGILREWDGGICTIPLKHFRVLKLENIVNMGDGRSLVNPFWY